VLDSLRKEVKVEFEQLRQLLSVHRSLLDKSHVHPPDRIELSALAAMLHAFYTGIENVFSRIALLTEGSKPLGNAWHRSLLEAMATPHPRREAVLSKELVHELKEYLAFRHMFRHAYTFHLRREKMGPLVLRCEEVLARLESEVIAFLNRLGED